MTKQATRYGSSLDTSNNESTGASTAQITLDGNATTLQRRELSWAEMKISEIKE